MPKKLSGTSGNDPRDVPGVGTFYDFLDRLWNLDSDNFSSHLKPPVTKKVKKPNVKGQKADPIEKESVEQLIARLSGVIFRVSEEAYGVLFRIFRSCFLEESIRKGKINPNRIHMASDGTPVVTAARFRSHHTCKCRENGITDCTCNRYYPQPDCDIGWDSSRERWYFGYDLYLLTDADSGLPLFPLLHPASKHDSHAFCEAFFRFRSFMPDLIPVSLLLDSAHDSMAMYKLCKNQSFLSLISTSADPRISLITRESRSARMVSLSALKASE